MAVFRFGDDQSSQKCTQGKGKSHTGSQPGNSETYCHNAQQKELPASRPGDLIQHPRHNPFGADGFKTKKGLLESVKIEDGIIIIKTVPSSKIVLTGKR